MATAQLCSLQQVRKALDKSQSELAELLGIGVRAVQSYEQGWRQCPSYIQRLAMMLLVCSEATTRSAKPCWQLTGCPSDRRRTCPGKQFGGGKLCWMISGACCGGKKLKARNAKAHDCSKCPVLAQWLPRRLDRPSDA